MLKKMLKHAVKCIVVRGHMEMMGSKWTHNERKHECIYNGNVGS